jgi:phosphoglucosamine mutase
VGRLFGTDGVRGTANADLTAELALDLAVAAAHVLGEAGTFAGHRPRAVVGRDPRASGEFLEAAVIAGLASAGVDVLRLGVVPTPCVAYLTQSLDVDLGVMISASHNPMPDNGIKFFARGGAKLPDSVEDAIAARMREPWQRPTAGGVGRVRRFDEEGVRSYVDHLIASVSHPLDGLRVVVDCAHGAASWVAPEALRRAGAEVIAIGAEPDGWNINDGVGSTHLDLLRQAVVDARAHAGIAHDGDADRCLAVTAEGDVVDGDQILAVLALALRDAGGLRHATVVATVMSNLGFRIAMEQAGIAMVETAVGDRYVLEAMKAGDYSLGGEQSGHLILLDHATTGDGVLTALSLLSRVAETGQALAELTSVVQRMPQVLVNVPDVDKSRIGTSEQIARAVKEAEEQLGATGRVLLRESGTEQLVRVMVEAPTQDEAQAVADRLANVVSSALGR